MTISTFSLVIYCSVWTPRLSKAGKFFLHVIIQVYCVFVCAHMCVHGRVTCACSLICAEMKGDTFIHINADGLVRSKRVNNVMLIKKDKKQSKIMEFIKGAVSRD